MNDKTKNLFQKLSIIRKKISVKKTGHNSFGNYNYYEIDEIYRKSKDLFDEYGIFTIFSLVFEPEIAQYRAILQVINTDNPDENFSMRIDSPLNEIKGSASQKVGSNNTYQSKYLYMDLLMLDDGKEDPDMTNTHGKSPVKPNYTQSKRVSRTVEPVSNRAMAEEFL